VSYLKLLPDGTTTRLWQLIAFRMFLARHCDILIAWLPKTKLYVSSGVVKHVKEPHLHENVIEKTHIMYTAW
jgi:hypothetical protein